MKKNFVLTLVLVAVVVCLMPTLSASAKSKKKSKMPKDGQKMYSLTFEEWCGNGNGYWEVSKDDNGKKQYRPYVLDADGVRCVMPKGYYVVVDGYLYYTKAEGYISFSKTNPRKYTITKYGYFIIPEEDTDPEPEPVKKEEEKKDTKKKTTFLPVSSFVGQYIG